MRFISFSGFRSTLQNLNSKTALKATSDHDASKDRNFFLQKKYSEELTAIGVNSEDCETQMLQRRGGVLQQACLQLFPPRRSRPTGAQTTDAHPRVGRADLQLRGREGKARTAIPTDMGATVPCAREVMAGSSCWSWCFSRGRSAFVGAELSR